MRSRVALAFGVGSNLSPRATFFALDGQLTFVRKQMPSQAPSDAVGPRLGHDSRGAPTIDWHANVPSRRVPIGIGGSIPLKMA